MRLVALTGGTGGFVCGTCLRDNWLVRALRGRGHEAMLVPLHLPIVTEGPSEAQGRPLFFGGIATYLRETLPGIRAFPPSWLRWLDAPALLRFAAARAGMTTASALGRLTVSMLRGEDGPHAAELERLARWLAREVRPEAILLSNALLAGLTRRLAKATGARVACTLQGEDAYLDAFPSPWREEAWATLTWRARDPDRFIAVSRYYADVMTRRLRLAPGVVTVVHNGIPLDDVPADPPAPRLPAVGYCARLCAEKGFDLLVDAFIALRRSGEFPGLKLFAAGTLLAADEDGLERARRRLADVGALEDVRILPNCSRAEKLDLLASVTVFSVPAGYGEAFGLYVLEALASGVPVVQPRSGAFPELLAATGGGRLCRPDDADDLARELGALLRSPAEARALGARGRDAVRSRFTMDRMAEQVAAALER